MARKGPKTTPIRLSEHPATPVMPADLTREQRRHWRRVVSRLREAGLLARLDSEVLAHYCRTRALLDRLQADVARDGFTYVADTGLVKQRPEATLLIQTSRLALDLERGLGLVPSSRKRYSMATPREAPCTTAAARYLSAG